MAPATDNTNTPTVSQDPNSFVNNIVREEIDIGNVPIGGTLAENEAFLVFL